MSAPIDPAPRSAKVWIVQPVSPRLNHQGLARGLGFNLMGRYPATHVDVPGRLLLVFGPFRGSDEEAAEALDGSKWIAGWRFELWVEGRMPFEVDPTFRILPFGEGKLPDAADFKHSLELPPWPPEKAGKA